MILLPHLGTSARWVGSSREVAEVVSPGAIIGGHCRVEAQSPKVAVVSQYDEK